MFALTPSLLDMLSRLLSDLPMSAALLVSLAFSVALLRALPNFRDTWRATGYSALLAGLLAAVALIRWAGMFAAFGVMLSFLISVPLRMWRNLWKQVLAVIVVFGGLVGGWLFRNKVLTGEIMGERNSHSSSVEMHLWRAAEGSFLWATDVRDFFGGESLGWFLYVGLLGVLGVLSVLGFRKTKLEAPVGLVVLGTTALAYFAGLVLSASNHAFNSLLHPRYWMAVWAVLLCVSFAVPTLASGRLKGPLRGAFILSLCIYAVVGVEQYRARHEAALVLQRTRAAPVQEVAPEMSTMDCQIVSNDNRVLLVNYGYEQLFRFPTSKKDFRKLAARGRICVVWVKPEGNSRLRVAKDQRSLLQFAEGRDWIHLDRRRRTYEIWLPGPS